MGNILSRKATLKRNLANIAQTADSTEAVAAIDGALKQTNARAAQDELLDQRNRYTTQDAA